MLQAVKQDIQTVSVSISVSSIGLPRFIDDAHFISWLSARLNTVEGMRVDVRNNDLNVEPIETKDFDVERFLLITEMQSQLCLLRDLRSLRQRKTKTP